MTRQEWFLQYQMEMSMRMAAQNGRLLPEQSALVAKAAEFVSSGDSNPPKSFDAWTADFDRWRKR